MEKYLYDLDIVVKIAHIRSEGYCHCKEPLEPGKYLFGCLFPGTVLGIGIYVAAFATGSNFLLWVSLFNVLAAGGDLLIAWYARKYRTGYVLDHPTECGFVIFQK